jgi:hypothetical protein
MGMIEFHFGIMFAGGARIGAGPIEPSNSTFGVSIASAAPAGGKPQDTLQLSLASFKQPNRDINNGIITYLNGNINYPGRPNALGNMNCVFRDYIDSGTRAVLENWFSRVYDETTGLGGLTQLMKIDADILLFGIDGSNARQYRAQGIYPINRPDVNIDFSDSEQQTMSVDFKVDFFYPIQL